MFPCVRGRTENSLIYYDCWLGKVVLFLLIKLRFILSVLISIQRLVVIASIMKQNCSVLPTNLCRNDGKEIYRQ